MKCCTVLNKDHIHRGSVDSQPLELSGYLSWHFSWWITRTCTCDPIFGLFSLLWILENIIWSDYCCFFRWDLFCSIQQGYNNSSQFIFAVFKLLILIFFLSANKMFHFSFLAIQFKSNLTSQKKFWTSYLTIEIDLFFLSFLQLFSPKK